MSNCRKRNVRERDPSPDMFLDDSSDGEGEENGMKESRTETKERRDSGICEKVRDQFVSCTTTEPEIPATIQAKKRQVLTSAIANQHLQSVVNCSMNSLMSSANSTFNCGLNNKMKEALRCNTQSKRKLICSTNTSISGQTPAVYTLNNTRIQTQLPLHSGPNYGLSDVTWLTIKKTKGISKLHDWQEECLSNAINTTRNLIYSLPTSGGKTLVAELLMIRELLCKQKDCLYVLPYVSIVQEKIRTLSSQAIALDFAVEEYAADRGIFPPRKRHSRRVIYIATIEKAQGIVNALMEFGRLSEIGLVVVDEIHMIGEGKRGATLETLICKLLLSPVRPRIVAMSATIGNIEELSRFLNADVYTKDFRPVKLREFIKHGDKLMEVRSNKLRSEETLWKEARCLPVGTVAAQRMDPDGLGILVAEVVPDHSCLVFCATKMNCESVAQLVIRQLSHVVLHWKAAEKRVLIKALELQSGKLCPVLKLTLPYGVAYHHSGLTADERQLIEDAFLSGVLCCLCCTSTLAAGVNLPARRVILRAPYIGADRLTRARYQQMIGRAGRTGLDTNGESILIAQPHEMPFVTNDILLAPIAHVQSQLIVDGLQGLEQMILSLVHLDLCGKDRSGLLETLRRSTLLGLQDPSGQHLLESIDQSIEDMVSMKLISLDEKGQVKMTKLGTATLKGNIELDRSTRLYDDLCFAQSGKATKLHLLYLMTPYNLVGFIRPVPGPYLEAFNKLSPEELDVARSLGVNETVMVKLMSGQQPLLDRFIVERFYLTLILNDLSRGQSYWKVSEFYGCARGDVQNLLGCATSFVSCVHYFVHELGEFRHLSDSLLVFIRQLSVWRNPELMALMELPSVPLGRARLLYDAGFRSLADLARSSVDDILSRVQHISKLSAQHIVAAAQVLVYEKVDALRDEAESLLQLVPKPILFPLNETVRSVESDEDLDN